MTIDQRSRKASELSCNVAFWIFTTFVLIIFDEIAKNYWYVKCKV